MSFPSSPPFLKACQEEGIFSHVCEPRQRRISRANFQGTSRAKVKRKIEIRKRLMLVWKSGAAPFQTPTRKKKKKQPGVQLVGHCYNKWWRNNKFNSTASKEERAIERAGASGKTTFPADPRNSPHTAKCSVTLILGLSRPAARRSCQVIVQVCMLRAKPALSL